MRIKFAAVFATGAFVASCSTGEPARAEQTLPSNCVYEAIHPELYAPREALAVVEDRLGATLFQSYLLDGFYVGVSTSVCSQINLEITLHSRGLGNRERVGEVLESTLDRIRNGSPFYSNLPDFSEEDWSALAASNHFEDRALSIDILEQDMGELVLARWSAIDP